MTRTEAILVGPWRWLPALAIAALIGWFSHQPDWPDAAVGYPDWLLHGLAFGSLAVTVLWGLRQALPGRPVSLRGGCTAVAIASLYGIVDELHQSFIAGRDAAVGDWIADTLGAGVVVLLAALTFAALRGVWENPPRSAPPAPSRDRE